MCELSDQAELVLDLAALVLNNERGRRAWARSVLNDIDPETGQQVVFELRESEADLWYYGPEVRQTALTILSAKCF